MGALGWPVVVAAPLPHWRCYTGEWRADGTRCEAWAMGPTHVYVFEVEVAVALRGQGRGSALLAEVCAAADADGVTLVLLPMAEGRRDRKRLIRWYGRHGFVLRAANSRGMRGMERVPRGAVAVRAAGQ